jgi:hypothetical protein
MACCADPCNQTDVDAHKSERTGQTNGTRAGTNVKHSMLIRWLVTESTALIDTPNILVCLFTPLV